MYKFIYDSKLKDVVFSKGNGISFAIDMFKYHSLMNVLDFAAELTVPSIPGQNAGDLTGNPDYVIYIDDPFEIRIQHKKNEDTMTFDLTNRDVRHLRRYFGQTQLSIQISKLKKYMNLSSYIYHSTPQYIYIYISDGSCDNIYSNAMDLFKSDFPMISLWAMQWSVNISTPDGFICMPDYII